MIRFGPAILAAPLLLAASGFAHAQTADGTLQQEDEVADDSLARALDALAGPASEDELASGEMTEEEREVIQAGGKRMTTTRTDVPPVLDGLVNEDVWERAEVVTDFLQREPLQGGTPSHKTEVRILYDDENIYLGFVMHDDPDAVLASDLRRDSRLQADDTVAVLFDTFHDHRNAFLFRVNALGTKYDATVKDERDINSSWDERWEAAAQLTDRGWEAEMAIPLKVLRYRTGSHVWGVDFKREIRRNNEEVNWSNYDQDFDFRAVSLSGHLLGLRNTRLTQRYRLTPYLSGSYSALDAEGVPLSSGDGAIGVEDFKARITSNLTADLTINTDFAQVESDQERVNLTRFPLFFSERREFFLEGADKFQFGPGSDGGGAPLVVLYHSRNIGLADGNPVPMNYGTKLTGKVGNTSVGVINGQTGDAILDGASLFGQNFSTLRLKQDVFERSSVGVIFTNVQGSGDYNRVGGVDANFRFFDNLSLGTYVAQSRDSGIDGANYAGRFGAGWSTDLWGVSAGVDYIDPEFTTDMGFLLRRDIIKQNYSASYNPRPGVPWLRQVSQYLSVEYITTTAGEIASREQSIWIRPQFESGDSISFSASRNFERLREGFEPGGVATVVAGDYSFTEWRVSLDSYNARTLSGRVNFGGGGYYGGTRRSYGASATIRFNEKFSLSPRYDFNDIAFPDGGFSTHVASVRAAYSFNDRILTNALIQYNSLSEQMSVYARLRFIYRTGDDFYLVYKSTTRYDPEFYGQSDHGLIAKFTRSFEF